MNPTRCCIVCRNRNNKCNLIRVIAKDNQAIPDYSQKMNSRGIYFCRDNKCLQKAQKSLLNNKLNIKISMNKDSLIQVLKNVEDELGE